MKFELSAVSLLPLLAAAAPAIQARDTQASAFTVTASHSGSSIHLLPMEAAGQYFWLGGNASTYCPENVANCPAGTETVFAPGGGALDVEVPGGQKIYVDPSGALRFTQAHSANIPAGSSQGPFTYTAGNPFGKYTYDGEGAKGWMACPLQNKVKGQLIYQVFVNMPNAKPPTGKVEDCIGFDALAKPYESKNNTAAAWQYI
ncbi:IgE-binding protein [Thermoascus aurantiacus ATCC 26904]